MALNKPLFLAFVDFKKAFNCVNHSLLLYKLLNSGIGGKFFKILSNMYSKLGAFIKINNLIFGWVKDQCGTNQGGPLSPNMFRYMLNNLKHFLNMGEGITLDDELIAHILWADDLVMLSDSAQGLQKQLDGLFNFCSKFQMIVNELKTKIMIYGNVQINNTNFIFNNKHLEIVSNYKYLGVILNSTKTLKGDIFKEMKPYISDKGRKATFAVLKKYSSLGKLPPLSACQLFDSHISSVLNYAADIWGQYKEIPKVESVHLKFLNIYFGCKRHHK